MGLHLRSLGPAQPDHKQQRHERQSQAAEQRRLEGSKVRPKRVGSRASHFVPAQRREEQGADYGDAERVSSGGKIT